ncbi:hypothetical protein BOTBODRAFT_62271 [Botryobasidium botryosum FD-172 SS1]|uniref:Myosin-binding domain-containing protein n=1 Tax=Botryobasidium botryosum (strain FD-172 SS1) TaxID=930990 RepID=A0A067N701_BOTB1|nr:hypothetical protein BOTBODRAFT_62271 [Botryobasidium botryosum FD-172 SS1]
MSSVVLWSPTFGPLCLLLMLISTGLRGGSQTYKSACFGLSHISSPQLVLAPATHELQRSSTMPSNDLYYARRTSYTESDDFTSIATSSFIYETGKAADQATFTSSELRYLRSDVADTQQRLYILESALTSLRLQGLTSRVLVGSVRSQVEQVLALLHNQLSLSIRNIIKRLFDHFNHSIRYWMQIFTNARPFSFDDFDAQMSHHSSTLESLLSTLRASKGAAVATKMHTESVQRQAHAKAELADCREYLAHVRGEGKILGQQIQNLLAPAETAYVYEPRSSASAHTQSHAQLHPYSTTMPQRRFDENGENIIPNAGMSQSSTRRAKTPGAAVLAKLSAMRQMSHISSTARRLSFDRTL